MENLPIEIASNIISRLPMVDKLQSREVCKTWKALVPKPKRGLLYWDLHRKDVNLEAQFYFSERNNDRKVGTKHVDDDDCLGTYTKLDHSLIMRRHFDCSRLLVGSYHGLVCCASSYSTTSTFTFNRSYKTDVHVCNPVTGEHIRLPTIDHRGSNIHPYYNCGWWMGFGYNRSSGVYKVVRISHGTVEVYTQGDTAWRNIKPSDIKKCFRPDWRSVGTEQSAGVFVGGALYWMGKYTIKPATVVAFDLEHETFELLPSIPHLVYDVYDPNAGLMVLGGNLCLLEVGVDRSNKHVTVWEYRKSATTKKSCWYVSPWLIKFSLVWEVGSWLEFGTMRNKYLLWYNAILSCYDPETKTLRKLDETLKKFMEDRSIYAAIPVIPFTQFV